MLFIALIFKIILLDTTFPSNYCLISLTLHSKGWKRDVYILLLVFHLPFLFSFHPSQTDFCPTISSKLLLSILHSMLTNQNFNLKNPLSTVTSDVHICPLSIIIWLIWIAELITFLGSRVDHSLPWNTFYTHLASNIKYLIYHSQNCALLATYAETCMTCGELSHKPSLSVHLFWDFSPDSLSLLQTRAALSSTVATSYM